MLPPDANRNDGPSVGRFRRWTAIAVAAAALGYTAYAVLRGVNETGAELVGFDWWLTAPVLALTLVNYGLRFVKWRSLLRGLGIQIPWRQDAILFTTGLAMVVTPGKAGELLKPWLVRRVTGAPLHDTIPALVTERLMDGIAVVLLATYGVGTFYAEGRAAVLGTLAVMLGGVALLMVRPLVDGVLDLVDRVPLVRRLVPRLRGAYDAMRVCLAPRSFAWALSLSVVAWWAECVGYWLVLRGLDVEGATLGASTFLYAFATVFGAPSPGGMGMADVALVEGMLAVVPDSTGGQALAAALLIRLATLWFGVALGAVALLGIDRWLPEAPAPLETGRATSPIRTQ